MTFMVNQDGVVYESDLGAETAKAATEVKAFNLRPGPRSRCQCRSEAPDENGPDMGIGARQPATAVSGNATARLPTKGREGTMGMRRETRSGGLPRQPARC